MHAGSNLKSWQRSCRGMPEQIHLFTLHSTLHTSLYCWILTVLALQARSLLSKVGGRVHHVHMEAGGRVSYKPYRDVSKVLIHRLRQFVGVGVIEKASIDEAYILYAAEPQHQQHGTTNMQRAAQLAQNIRHAGTSASHALFHTLHSLYACKPCINSNLPA